MQAHPSKTYQLTIPSRRVSGLSPRPSGEQRRRARFSREVSRWLRPEGVVTSLCGNQRHRRGILHPECVDDVSRIVAAASRAAGAVKLQPVSCGRNWGFGSELAATDGAYTLDLSRMKAIRSLDLRRHCVQLEPGVTQGQLDESLRSRGGTHYLNVTGAGLSASVIGNALERGIGYWGQRHLDVLDLEVVLPAGGVVRTSRIDTAAHGRHGAGLGPDPSGLFFQGNLGVVTAATLALRRRPEVMGAVTCRLADASALPELASRVSDLLAEGACHGVPHIFNRERLVTTLSPHMDDEAAARLRQSAACWTALFPVSGVEAVFAALAKDLREALEDLGAVEILGETEGAARNLDALIQGHPSDVALAGVAFAVFGRGMPVNTPLESTGAGLIHVTPLFDLTAEASAEVLALTGEVLSRHGWESVPLSLNAVSPRTAVLVVSIGFDRRSAERTSAAHRAADELLGAYSRAGIAPYRLGLGQAAWSRRYDRGWEGIMEGIRRVFDPAACLAESRYEPLWSHGKTNSEER